MAVNRDKVKRQMAESKQRSGAFRFLPKDTTTALRIAEFEDADGDMAFARVLAEHRKKGSTGGKADGVCRLETFGQPCAFCKVNDESKGEGGDRIYDTKRRYAVNGIDINEKQPAVKIWLLPVTAYEQIAEYVTDEEYADILEQKPGLPFNCKKEGSGLDTTYTCKPKRESWPISKDLMAQVSDPVETFVDPGLEAQCSELGYDVSELFDDSELEALNGSGEKKKSSAKKETSKTSKKSSPKSKAKKADSIDVGSSVLYEDEDVIYTVVSISGDEVEIQDDEENLYDATLDQLKLIDAKQEDAVEDDEPVEEPEEEETSGEIVVGCEVNYLDEKDICTVKKITKNKVVIEDSNGDQYDVEMEDLTYAGLPF